MSLLPSRVAVDPDPGEPRVIDLAAADETFEVLGSATARAILTELYDQPRTPPEIQEIVGTSLQNVHYHLDRLESRDLIEPAGIGYSKKGTEMTVYAPASRAVVVVAGRDRERARLRELLAHVVGAIAVLAGAALAFDAIIDGLAGSAAGPERVELAADTTGHHPAVELLGEPAVAFALGGLLALAGVAAWLYWRRP